MASVEDTRNPRTEGFLLKSVRLNKFLARQGICSRRAADQLIASGRVEVNGKVVKQLGALVDPLRDSVLVDGEVVAEAPEPVVLLFHKPAGVLSTCRASRERGPIILDYLPKHRRLYPVGRLDKDSSGLLLVTDDGDLAFRLSHPSFGSTKIYRVTVHSEFDLRDLRALAKGVMLEDGFAKPVAVRRLGPSVITIELTEGRNRQIRRMLSVLGHRVRELVRIEQSGIKLGALAPGRWRELAPREIGSLRNSLARANTLLNKEST